MTIKLTKGKLFVLFLVIVSVAQASPSYRVLRVGVLNSTQVFTNCWLTLTWSALIAEGPAVDFGKMQLQVSATPLAYLWPQL